MHHWTNLPKINELNVAISMFYTICFNRTALMPVKVLQDPTSVLLLFCFVSCEERGFPQHTFKCEAVC